MLFIDYFSYQNHANKKFFKCNDDTVLTIYWVGEKVSSYFNVKVKQVFFIF